MYLEDAAGKRLTTADALAPRPHDTYVVDSVSTSLFANYESCLRPWLKDAVVPLVTVRPMKKVDEKGGKFADDFFETLEARGVRIVVITACSDLAPLSWVTTTRHLPIPPAAAALAPLPLK